MTDDQIKALIFDEIKKRGITWQDMIGGKAVNYETDHQRVCRNNVFKAEIWSNRLMELICDGDYDPSVEGHIIRVSIQDLMRFWWNNCICQEYMMDDILEDIFVYFKDKMCPVEAPEPAIVCNIDFSQVIPDDQDKIRAVKSGGINE